MLWRRLSQSCDRIKPIEPKARKKIPFSRTMLIRLTLSKVLDKDRLWYPLTHKLMATTRNLSASLMTTNRTLKVIPTRRNWMYEKGTSDVRHYVT